MSELKFEMQSDDPVTKIPREWHWSAIDQCTEWRIDHGHFSPEGDHGFFISWRFLPLQGGPGKWSLVNRRGFPGYFDTFDSKVLAIKAVEEIREQKRAAEGF